MNVIQEKYWIEKGLLFYWDCAVCHQLGWDVEAQCKHIKKDCNRYVYQRLHQHFQAWDKQMVRR